MSAEVEERKDISGEECLPEANEPIRNASELEQEKQRITQDFHAQGNIGTTQVFINSLGAMNWGSQQAQTATSLPSSTQTYQLHTRKGCTDFVERYKNSEHLAVAIVLSTFELVCLNDLSELKSLLMEELPTAELAGEDSTPVVRDPYIAVDTCLAAIGGEWFTNQDGQPCVGLGAHSQQALQTLWEQFPALRDPICRWLIQLSRVYKFRTAFDAYQLVCAFVRVISLDFEDAKRRIFSQLCSCSDNTGLLGNIMYKLYKGTALQQEIEHMLLDWLGSKSSWLWHPACWACSFLMPELDRNKFGPPLEKALRRRLEDLTNDDYAFMAVLLIQSEYFRTVLTGLLGKAVQHADKRDARLMVLQTYLYLLRSCYYLVDADCPALPLAVCDTLQQQQSLTPVLREVISQAALRRQLYAILRAYLKELPQYQYPAPLFKHLCAFFYNMAQSAPDYWPDILQFLDSCKGTLSRQIYERLLPMYHPTRQLSSTV